MNESLFEFTVGADEAGRGPLAGPVCAAAVALPNDFPFEILNDSKKLSEKKRVIAASIIKEKAIAWAVTFVSHKKIDEINILNASLLAMKLSFEKVQNQLIEKGFSARILLVDGNKTPKDINIECQAIVKGDSKVPEIMAASILAKTSRDLFMKKAAIKWPGYGFEVHKGYPTVSHREAIKRLGPSPIHRMTFKF